MSTLNNSIATQVLHWACTKILAGDWKAGDPIDERQIAAQLEMNPNLIHDAFEALIRTGLVVQHGNKPVLSDRAQTAAREVLRNYFFEFELPVLKEKLNALHITWQELLKS